MIVDGGLGVELAARGFTFSTNLWSGEAVLTRPDLLAQVHRAYLAAGAQVIETATYQLAPAGLRALGHDDAAIDAAFALAVRIARGAIDAHRAASGAAGPFVVAGSLGPHAATIGDRSEYSGRLHLGRDALYAFHAERARVLARAQPDLIFFETIPTAAEALVVAEVARDLQLPRVWLALSCVDGMFTYGGDCVADVAAQLEAFDSIEAIGVNCTPPAAIAPLVRTLRAATAKAIVVCPNLEVGVQTDQREFIGSVREWLDLGATHLGGCCGVGPQTIAAIARAATGVVQ